MILVAMENIDTGCYGKQTFFPGHETLILIEEKKLQFWNYLLKQSILFIYIAIFKMKKTGVL